MLFQAFNTILYGLILLSLFLIDYILGNGFVDMFQKVFCKFACFVKRSVREEAKLGALITEDPINLPMLITEIIILSLTVAWLNKYKQKRGFDKLDELLRESKEALRQTNEFLEKWRLRRVPTYLDDEPQEIKPLKLEVPILHMAIVDTKGTTRSQPESGDAGDTFNIADSTLLSVTSLTDEDLESITEPASERLDDRIEFKSRYLWDVVEEDANNLDD
ncbi:uncharacterized protein ACR2FA_005128 [Aphomia sociella]